MTETMPQTMRLLMVIAAHGGKSVGPREAFRGAGLTIRAGKLALHSLRETGCVEGSPRWIRLTAIGRDASKQLSGGHNAQR